MLIDRAYAPVVTLGPETRIAVWTVGCSKQCKGCANPELWRANPAQEMDDAQFADALIGMAQQGGIRRITFSGGDPFEQPESLARVLAAIRPFFDDILVYTGYTLEELHGFAHGTLAHLRGMSHDDAPCAAPQPCQTQSRQSPSDRAHHACLAQKRIAVKTALDLIDALVDGPYIESLNDGICAMRGSSNQRVHVFNDALRDDYDTSLKQPRHIQNVHFGDTFMSIGIHGRPQES